jgi:hypothetical protein
VLSRIGAGGYIACYDPAVSSDNYVTAVLIDNCVAVVLMAYHIPVILIMLIAYHVTAVFRVSFRVSIDNNLFYA